MTVDKWYDDISTEDVKFSRGIPEVGHKTSLQETDYREQFLSAALKELADMLREMHRESNSQHDLGAISLLLDPENIEKIYLSEEPFGVTVFVVEYAETPEWFSMPEEELREFYWMPHPAHPEEKNAAYFQPREAL